MLDDIEVRLECLRLATVLHENDVPEVTQLLATSDCLLDYVLNGRGPVKRNEPVVDLGQTFSGFLKHR
jgi:hypothetical protein